MSGVFSLRIDVCCIHTLAVAGPGVGLQPDLNDGVRLNIRLFLAVPDVGKKGAVVLRDRRNINWNKNRGKDVESAAWYYLFHGDRSKEYHLSLSAKRAARENTQREPGQ